MSDEIAEYADEREMIQERIRCAERAAEAGDYKSAFYWLTRAVNHLTLGLPSPRD
jgi:hypothetical protein